jgi:hypothetical protein
LADIESRKQNNPKGLPYNEMRMIELLMNNYEALQPMQMTVDEAWAEFCAGKCKFVASGVSRH